MKQVANSLQDGSCSQIVICTESRDGEHEDKFVSGSGEEVGTSFASAAAQGLAR